MKPTKCPAKQQRKNYGKKSEKRGEERRQRVKVKTAVSLLNGRIQKKGPPVHRPPLWTWSMDLIVDPVHGLTPVDHP